MESILRWSVAGVEVVMAEGDDGVFSLLQAHGWKREVGFEVGLTLGLTEG